MRKIRLLIVEKCPATRACVRALLDSLADVEVVGEAGSEREALTKASAVNPDIVLLNGRSISETAWPDFAEKLAGGPPKVRALLTALGDDTVHFGSLLETTMSVMERSVSEDQLMSALSQRWGATLPTVKRPEEVQHRQPPSATDASLIRGSLLSPREHEVLLLLAEGYANREIAEKLFRSIKTVETYRANIKRKLGLTNRAEIVRYVRAAGLLNRTA